MKSLVTCVAYIAIGYYSLLNSSGCIVFTTRSSHLHLAIIFRTSLLEKNPRYPFLLYDRGVAHTVFTRSVVTSRSLKVTSILSQVGKNYKQYIMLLDVVKVFGC